ncbi:MAG: hypothetical protein JO006_01870 [Paucibacter sp.]|nr:hypothetical protein [Roseateles sp.]
MLASLWPGRSSAPRWQHAFVLASLLLGSAAQAVELRIPVHPGAHPACERLWQRLAIQMPDLSLRRFGDPMTAARRDRMLLDGSLDADCGTIPAPRATGLRYSQLPVYQVHLVLVLRADDPLEIKGQQELRRQSEQSPLLLNRGSLFRPLLEKLGVRALDDTGAHTEQNIAKLLAGHGRIFVYQQPGLDSKLKAFHLEGKVRVLAWSPGRLGYHLAYSPHLAPGVAARLDEALRKLAQSGELDRLGDAESR